MSATAFTESHNLDDKSIPSAIGAEIDDLRSQFPQSPKRKLAETGDGGSQPPPPMEKRNRGDETEESESEGEMKVPDYMVEYYKKISAILGKEVDAETLDGLSDGDEYIDEDDQLVGDKSILFAYPELQKKWSGSDPLMCCDHPFNDLDFKHDTKLYDALKAFGENAVKYLNARYNYEEASFQDIKRVSSCPAPCNHRVVALKAVDRSHHAVQIVLQGQLPLEDFAQAKPNQFIMLEHCTVR